MISPINRTIGIIWDSFVPPAFSLPPTLHELQNIPCTESPSVPNSEAGPHVRTNNKGKCCHIQRGEKVQSDCHFYKHYFETRASTFHLSAINKTVRAILSGVSLTLYKKPGPGGAESSVECIQAIVRGRSIFDNKLVDQTIGAHRDLVLLTCLQGVGFM